VALFDFSSGPISKGPLSSSSGDYTADLTMDQDSNTHLDQIDEDILTCNVSDEALEAAAAESLILMRASKPHTMWCPLCG
jgi:hypothetical protein